MTKTWPARGLGPAAAAAALSLTPAFRSRRTSSRFSGWAKKKTMLSATLGPTSSAWTSSSRPAASRASRSRSGRPASGPAAPRRGGCPGRRGAGPGPATSRLRSRRGGCGRSSVPAARGPRGRRAEAVEVGDGADELGGQELVDDGFAEPVDVHRPAPGEMEDDSRRRAGQDVFSQREMTSPSGRKTFEPQTGQRLGKANALAPRGRRSFITETTLGMTSPLRSTRTSSPTRMSLRRSSSSLCRVDRLTVVPDRRTGSSTATGVRAPVRPTWTMMSRSFVVAWRAGNLKATAPRGALAVDPRSALDPPRRS